MVVLLAFQVFSTTEINHIWLCFTCLQITDLLESAHRFISLAYPVISRLTSFTCHCRQLIFVIVTAHIIHHFFALYFQAQNLPFQQILPTLILLLPLNCIYNHGTALIMVVDLFLVHFLFNFYRASAYWCAILI